MMVRRLQVTITIIKVGLLCFIPSPVSILAMIPPHPDFDKHNNTTTITSTTATTRIKTATNFRRMAEDSIPSSANNVATTIATDTPHGTTRLLNPELCRFETTDLCQTMDDEFIQHASRTRNLVETTGNLKVLVLLLQFSDHTTRDLVDTMDVSILFNDPGQSSSSQQQQQGQHSSIIPTGSIQSYLRTNSHNKLIMEATIIPWLPLPEGLTEEYCTFGKSGLDRQFQKCFWPILDALDILHTNENHPFTWADYDQNFDGYLDSVVVMHSGYGAEWGGTDPNGKDSTHRIWSHSIGPQRSVGWQSSHFPVSLGSYCVTSVFQGFDGRAIAPIGLVAHELIHTFGIPDLFDLSRSDQKGGVGSYSIMSDAWGPGGDPTLPGHLDPWSKMQLGWLTPKEITVNGTYNMEPSSEDVYMISTPYPDGEYLLIENRQPLDFDASIWTGGALVWHIDDTVLYNVRAGGPYQPGWPQNGNHYRVALVQADGLFELEQGINKGHAADFFTGGETSQHTNYLGPGKGNTIFPNTDSYQDGTNIRETNLELSNFIQFGTSISFIVNGLSSWEESNNGGNGNDSDHRPPPPLPPIISPDACLVQVNRQLCSNHMDTIVKQDGCDCYNICGNGIDQACCKFGEPCQIDCHSGGLVAGCTHDENNDAVPANVRSSEIHHSFVQEDEETTTKYNDVVVEVLYLDENNNPTTVADDAAAVTAYNAGACSGFLLWSISLSLVYLMF